jgi:hypothetical protein
MQTVASGRKRHQTHHIFNFDSHSSFVRVFRRKKKRNGGKRIATWTKGPRKRSRVKRRRAVGLRKGAEETMKNKKDKESQIEH